MTVAQTLKTRRLELSLTQEQVAARAEMSTVQYNGYERERHKPSADTLKRLANALRTSVASLSEDGNAHDDATTETLKEALRQRIAKEANWNPERVRVVIHLE